MDAFFGLDAALAASAKSLERHTTIRNRGLSLLVRPNLDTRISILELKCTVSEATSRQHRSTTSSAHSRDNPAAFLKSSPCALLPPTSR